MVRLRLGGSRLDQRSSPLASKKAFALGGAVLRNPRLWTIAARIVIASGVAIEAPVIITTAVIAVAANVPLV
jgi:hypothetical protein